MTRLLSVGQEALWLIHRMAPDSPAYNVVVAARIVGELDPDVLRAALRATAQRHDMMRSAFVETDGGVRRVVHDADSVCLEVHETPADIGEEQLHELVYRSTANPLRLAESAYRVTFFRRTPVDGVLALTAHHVATDASSQGIVMRDLIDACAQGGDPAWEPLAATWDDHVAAERALLRGPGFAEHEQYWREICAGAPAVLELPTDRPRPARSRMRGATVEVRLADELTERLRASAFGRGFTPFVFLTGVFQAVVHRHSGQNDFLTGWPTTTRLTRDMREVAGSFANSLVLRAVLDRDTTFDDLFRAVDTQVKQGLAHVGYPFALLPKALGLPHDPSRPPLTQVAVTMVTANRLRPLSDVLAAGEQGGREYTAGPLRVRAFDVPQQEGQCDVMLEIVQSSTSIRAFFKYDAELFDRAWMERFAGRFIRFVEAATEDPDQQVGRVSILSERERQALLAIGVG
ncbi:condensation domain-containing protein [Streptomyces sp. NPDC007095]|uniref:condensation domain-containing protein n=1 Tax=Streptomyces sp. NPDC007095 TaxID=3154482 RepID=UPI000C70C6F3